MNSTYIYIYIYKTLKRPYTYTNEGIKSFKRSFLLENGKG